MAIFQTDFPPAQAVFPTSFDCAVRGVDGKSPYVGEDGFWYEWRAGRGYVHTGVSAQGPMGPAPLKGRDYWTDDDKDDLSQHALNAVTPLAAAAQAARDGAAQSAQAAAGYTAQVQPVLDSLPRLLEVPSLAAQAQESARAAAASAGEAAASETAARQSAQAARQAAEQAQSIGQGAKGFFETPSALLAAHPDETGQVGWWAIVGSTDTIWVWDADTSAWKNTHLETDLSGYYTKQQADGRFGTLAALEAAAQLAGAAAPADTVYPKTETYTRQETDAAIGAAIAAAVTTALNTEV